MTNMSRDKSWWFEEKHGWDLKSVRDAIAWVDAQLIELMSERFRLGWNVARIKHKNGSAIFDGAQETRVISRWVNRAEHDGVPQELINSVVDVVKILMEATKKVQHGFLANHSKSLTAGMPEGKEG